MSNETVITSGAASFDADVIAASHEHAVLVDFWAEWCAPCRSIAPMLEELAEEFGGALIVVKVDTDAEQPLAQAYGIRSLPTLLLFRHGKPVEQIIGAQPASAIRAVIEKVLPRASDKDIDTAEALLADGDAAAAVMRLQDALSSDAENPRIQPLLAQALVRAGDYDAAEALLAELPINLATDAVFAPVKAKLHLANLVPPDIDRAALHKQTIDAEDVTTRFHRAVLRAMDDDFETALDELLDLIVRHRAWGDGAIHQAVLDIFAVMGSDDPRIKPYRTQLARILN